MDLETIDGKILPERTQPQMEPVENLDHDWSQVVTPEGEQVATVGHHFQLSRAFNKDELQHISREGTCIACHQEIPEQSLAVSLLHHVAEYTGQLPKTTAQHDSLVHKIVLSSARRKSWPPPERHSSPCSLGCGSSGEDGRESPPRLLANANHPSDCFVRGVAARPPLPSPSGH